MPDDIILNDAEPTIELVHQWGYDENLYFIEQDEDLILHDIRYVPALMELASDANCPKCDYALSILSYFSQLVILFNQTATANIIAAHVESSIHRNNPRMAMWIEYFRSIHDRLVHPRSLSDNDMEILARNLLNGQCAFRRFERTGYTIDGHHEFTCYTDSYRGYIYINPGTGRWQQSRYNRLSRIDEYQAVPPVPPISREGDGESNATAR